MMKTYKISNPRFLTSLLFVALGLNLSWNLKNSQSLDFASTSLECLPSDLQTAIQSSITSVKDGTNRGALVTCSSYDLEVKGARDKDDEDLTITRQIEVRAVKISPAPTADGTTPAGDTQYQITFVAKVATEAGTCDDANCHQVVQREHSEIVSVTNDSQINTKVSELANSTSLKTNLESLFRSGQNQIRDDIKKILAELKDREDEDDAKDEMEEAIERCEIEPDVSIEDFVKYQKGDMDDDDVEDMELASKEKLTCMQRRLNSMRTDEKNDYFYNEMMPLLQDMLMGSSADQSAARKMIGTLNKDLSSGSRGLARGLNATQRQEASQVLQMSLTANDIFKKFGGVAAEIKANPDSPQAEQRIQEFKNMMASSFDLASRNAQLGSQAGAMATSWRDKLYSSLGLTPFTQGSVKGLASLDTRALDARLNPNPNNARVLGDTQLTSADRIADIRSGAKAIHDAFSAGTAWSGNVGLVMDRQNALGVYDGASNPNQVFPTDNFTGNAPIVPNPQNVFGPPTAGQPVPPSAGGRIGRG